MKAVQKMRMFVKARPYKTTPCDHRFFCSTTVIKQQEVSSNTQLNLTNDATLTEEEITEINLLVPRLCSSNHFKEATNLITTALHTNPPIESLPIPILLQSLTIEPATDLTQTMYLLNQIKFSPKIVSFLKPITKMFVSCYFDKGLPRHALKIFQWVSRSDFPKGCVDLGCFDALVNGFWRHGMILEALRVLRVMVNENMEIKDCVRISVYRGLLREARVREALELKKGLEEYVNRGGECKDRLIELLDRLIAVWIE